MTEQALRKMIAAGESTRQEFKSWVKCKDYRQRKELAVKSAVALANTGTDGSYLRYDPAQPVYRNRAGGNL